MTGATASVIIVSWGRPHLLRRTCLSVWHQTHRPLELVVVADDHGLAALRDLPFEGQIKTAWQSAPNISQARNDGIALAGGAVCAFLDDDAAAEPNWLAELAAQALKAGAATGPTLGRNGISQQWGRMALTRTTGERSLTTSEAFVEGEIPKLIGTNMAIRRDIMSEIGGFDPAFGYYLEDADLSVRLSDAGVNLAYAPDAIVHHSFAESERRRGDRVPLDLGAIATSQVAFLRKHAPSEATFDDALDAFRAREKARIATLLRGKRIDSGHALVLTESLGRGLAQGHAHDLPPPPTIEAAPSFQPLRTDDPKPPLILHGRWFQEDTRLAEAQAYADTGHPAALFVLEPTIRAHRMQFTEGGVWRQYGGLFGPSDRGQPRCRYWRYNQRVAAEMSRFGPTRAASYFD